MVDFDITNLAADKQEKIAIGALKYIAIKKAFELKMPLYENVLFRKYFTDFYGLEGGSWKNAVSQEIFYRLFEGIRVNYADNLNNTNDLVSTYTKIYNFLSYMSGHNEKSFSSKILHTLCDISPIIDSNILGGFGISAQEDKGIISSKKAMESYEKLLGWYYNTKQTKITKSYKNKSKKEDIIYNADKGFIEYIESEEFKKEVGNFSNKFVEICYNAYDKLRTTFSKDFEELKISNVETELRNISLVKKIDFYLWANFSDKKGKNND